MLENIILGIIQGVAEWLPISSEGVLILVQTRFLGSDRHILELIQQALFLHIGTVLAVAVYFRKDIWRLIKIAFGYQLEDESGQKLFSFIFFTALITGGLGYFLLILLSSFESRVALTGQIITLLIGVFLLIVGFLQLKANSKKGGKFKKIKDLTLTDGFVLGIFQALAVLPGMSRSGMTIAPLLLRKYDKITALRLSFLMSLPVVLGGNVIMNFKYLAGQFNFNPEMLWGLLFSFLIGLLTIDLFLRLAKKINFAYFVLFFACLVIVLAFL